MTRHRRDPIKHHRCCPTFKTRLNLTLKESSREGESYGPVVQAPSVSAHLRRAQTPKPTSEPTAKYAK